MADTMPTPPLGDFGHSFRVDLDGTFYRMQYRWNPRDFSWYLDVATDAGVSTVRGIRLVIGTDKLDPHKSQGVDRIPQGVLSVVDTSGKGIEAERVDIGVRVIVTYEGTG